MGASNHPQFAFPKGQPAIVAKVTKRNKAINLDRVEKEKVRVRDKEACRVCGRKTRDVHERVFKSLGGVASLVNSMCACRFCHPYLQHHGIEVFGPSCNSKLTFEMQQSVAHFIFRGRAVPAHVTVTVPK
jgi:hypothetical protein